MNDVDITTTVAPKTDQLNADDFIGTGDHTIKITGVKMMDSKEQPLAISYDGDKGKPWKPSLGMRRVLIELWGQEAAKAANKHYPGRTIVLYRDPDVKFGKDTVGGIRIRAASDINSEKKMAVTVSKARRVEFIVKPIKNAPAPKQQEQAPPPQNDTSTEKPPHVKTALKMVEAIKECEDFQSLNAYWDDKLTQDELQIVELAKKETADHVRSKYAERLNELSIPE